MKPTERIASIRAAAERAGWLVNNDGPQSNYGFTAVHFDGMGTAVTIYVMSDMQGRISTTLYVGGIGVQVNARLFELLDVVNVHRVAGQPVTP